MTQKQLVQVLRKLADILEAAGRLRIYRYEIALNHHTDLIECCDLGKGYVSLPAHPILLTVDIEALLED